MLRVLRGWSITVYLWDSYTHYVWVPLFMGCLSPIPPFLLIPLISTLFPRYVPIDVGCIPYIIAIWVFLRSWWTSKSPCLFQYSNSDPWLDDSGGPNDFGNVQMYPNITEYNNTNHIYISIILPWDFRKPSNMWVFLKHCLIKSNYYIPFKHDMEPSIQITLW